MKKTALSLAVMVTALFLAGTSVATGAVFAESQPDQQQASSEYSWPVDRWNTLVGQTFTAGVSGRLGRVSVHAGCCQNSDQALAPGLPPGDLVVKIHAVDPTTGEPTDVVLGSGREPASSFPTDGSLAWVDVDLGQAAGVEAGKTYAIVVSDTGNGYERWQWYALGAAWRNPYPGGTFVYADRYEGAGCPPLLSGWDWGRRRYDDIAFRTFVELATPDPAPADTTAPDTCISSGPSGLINDSTPTFNFDGADNQTAWANLLYSYKLDGGGWSAFSSEKSLTLGGASSLPDGAHTFHLKARDEAGNEDASPVERSFTVDTTAPTVASVDPANGARGVPRNTDVEVTFSEGVHPCSVQGPSFTLARWNEQKRTWQFVPSGLSTQPGEVGCIFDPPPTETATLDPYPSDPSRLLAKDARYRAVVTSEVMDPAGNFLAEDHVWYFRTRGG